MNLAKSKRALLIEIGFKTKDKVVKPNKEENNVFLVRNLASLGIVDLNILYIIEMRQYRFNGTLGGNIMS